jgi:hypothetical protein
MEEEVPWEKEEDVINEKAAKAMSGRISGCFDEIQIY